jgi:hypothetical protein
LARLAAAGSAARGRFALNRGRRRRPFKKPGAILGRLRFYFSVYVSFLQ